MSYPRQKEEQAVTAQAESDMSKFNIKTLEIAGFASAVQALRLPFKKECRSLCTTTMKFNDDTRTEEPYIETCAMVDFEPKDLHLSSGMHLQQIYTNSTTYIVLIGFHVILIFF